MRYNNKLFNPNNFNDTFEIVWTEEGVEITLSRIPCGVKFRGGGNEYDEYSYADRDRFELIMRYLGALDPMQSERKHKDYTVTFRAKAFTVEEIDPQRHQGGMIIYLQQRRQ